jgi:hypothetical protein
MVFVFEFKNEIYEKKSYKNNCESKRASIAHIAGHVEKR